MEALSYYQMMERMLAAETQSAGNIDNQWKPDVCPITGRRFFMWIEHPELGYVPTYGGPYDSYTIPTRDGDGEFSCERYDHDFGGWVDGECVGAYLIDDDEQCRVYELEQRTLAAEARVVELEEVLTTHAVAWTNQDALDDSICGSTAMMGPFNVVGDIPLIVKPQLPPKEA